MNGSVLYDGNTLLSGAINVNTGGNVEPLNVNITENGTQTINAPVGVDGYNPITIATNVPSEEPNIQSMTVTISENGVAVYHASDVDCDGFDPVTIRTEVTPTLDDITITQNGTYTPPTGVDGYDEVNVSVSGYTIKTLSTTPTSIASFNDGTDNPLKSLTATIVPVQSGSGEPSPTNVRPISGWDEANVVRTGKNLFDANNLINDRTIDVNGELAGYGGRVATPDYIPVKPNTSICLSYSKTVSQNVVFIYALYKDGTLISRVANNSMGAVIQTENANQIRFAFYDSVSASDLYNIQLEYGNTATTYEPYNGTTTTIPFTDSQGNPVEVYGGSVDVVNGGGNAYKEYPSYNGETLIGPWISDRDVYAPNTTPTTGAQVVDMGDTTTFYTQPTSIKSLDGVNNVFASTGDVEELKYFTNL